MATYEATRYSITGANILGDTIPAPSIVDGTVSNANFERINTVSSNVQTQLNAKVATTGATITGDFDFEDDAKARFGDGNDLEIYHDGSNSYIKNSTGYIKFLEDNYAFNNNADSATFLSISSSGLTGVGTGLTALNATNLGSGTVPDARFPATLPAISGANLTSLPVPSLSLNIQVLTSGNYTPTTGLTWATVTCCSGGESGEAVANYGGLNPYGTRIGGGGGYAGNFVSYTYTAAEMGTGTSTVTYGAGGATSTASAAPTGGGTQTTTLRNPGGNTLFDPQGTGTTLISLGVQSSTWKDSDFTTAGQLPIAGKVGKLGYNTAPAGSSTSTWNQAQDSAIGARPFQCNRLSGAVGALASIGSGSTTTSANGGAASMPGAGGGGGVARALPYFSASGQGGAGGAGFVIVYEYLLT